MRGPSLTPSAAGRAPQARGWPPFIAQTDEQLQRVILRGEFQFHKNTVWDQACLAGWDPLGPCGVSPSLASGFLRTPVFFWLKKFPLPFFKLAQ